MKNLLSPIQFEEVAANAWPSLQSMLLDGWLLRFANGITRRANSVLPLYSGMDFVASKVQFCEEIYAKQGLPTIFKLVDVPAHRELDKVLAEMCYTIDAPTFLQTIPLANGRFVPSLNIVLSEVFTEGWLEYYMAFSNHSAYKQETFRQIITQIRCRCCFALVQVDGVVVGCGLGVYQNGFVGLFDLVVAPPKRGCGYGRSIVESLLSWGEQCGAGVGYLQVMEDNSAALSLYKSVGFTSLYRSWYRIKGMLQ